ncbi:unnamed protein product [Protopolystoma xenopodis]|uniref:Uncharacterized protein n=1 Tax=Protopolystoma xenopodis TaxID=117903 RepID=A0A448WEH2_9PLAT|nr:unnamed protein product [Protopolystoma xenopodis]
MFRTLLRELARACLKHFEIEQELAFQKIDGKISLLSALGDPPKLHPEQRATGTQDNPMDVIRQALQLAETSNLPGSEASPYLGRCSYRLPSKHEYSAGNRVFSRVSLPNGLGSGMLVNRDPVTELTTVASWTGPLDRYENPDLEVTSSHTYTRKDGCLIGSSAEAGCKEVSK